MAILLLFLAVPLSWTSLTASHAAGLAMSIDLEPCSGQDKSIAGEQCCFVCPPVLFALPERGGEPSPLISATSLPAPERAQGTDPEPLRRPPRS
ncbi:hypothetical protein [Taklimakanibacter deserti]|uniref:hypothetical protein n=1 Tax=Taklimakanibacter deserti TaxID=2267839 RepID=UPI000E6532B6